MRVNKFGVGVILAASVLLTGCAAGGSDKPADAKPSAGASQEAEAPASDCPELKEGATIDGATLGGCVSVAAEDTAGYAASMSIMDMTTSTRHSPADEAVELTTPMGSVIKIGDESWVKTATSEWQVADPNSTDPIIAGLSTGAASATAMDPTAMATALTGDYTVTGTGTRLGQKVFLLSGTIEQEGIAMETVYEVTADYVPLAMTSTADMNGQPLESVFEVTEWDVKQDIVAPL